jgi:hypothetical protein
VADTIEICSGVLIDHPTYTKALLLRGEAYMTASGLASKSALSHLDLASKDLYMYLENHPRNLHAIGLLLKCEKMRSNLFGIIELLNECWDLCLKFSPQ